MDNKISIYNKNTFDKKIELKIIDEYFSKDTTIKQLSNKYKVPYVIVEEWCLDLLTEKEFISLMFLKTTKNSKALQIKKDFFCMESAIINFSIKTKSSHNNDLEKIFYKSLYDVMKKQIEFEFTKQIK